MNTKILTAELRDEFLNLFRNPAALFFSVLMPVGFFALTVTIFGRDGNFTLAGLGAFGAFAVIFVVMMNPGVGLAAARETGWIRIKRASGTPIGVTLVAKVIASIPYALAVLVAMVATAVGFGALEFDLGATIRVILALVLGSLPFALFGLAVGAKLGTNATTAAINAVVFPMVVASGLWFPLEILPDAVQRVAHYLPAYHLSQLASAQVDGSSWTVHGAALALTGLIGAIAAGSAYRSARP